MLTLDWIGNFGYSVLRLSTPLILSLIHISEPTRP